MIKSAIISVVVVASLTATCSKEKAVEENSKSCFETLKEQLQNAPPQTPPGAIWEYSYNDSIVYLVPAPCCDQFNPIYNLECKVICHPDGGITGKGDGQCNDFHRKATGKKLLWADKRSVK